MNPHPRRRSGSGPGSVRMFLPNRSDLLLCLGLAPVVGVLLVWLPTSWFVGILSLVSIANGTRWGVEEAETEDGFRPVAAIDGVMMTSTHLVVFGLLARALFGILVDR